MAYVCLKWIKGIPICMNKLPIGWVSRRKHGISAILADTDITVA